jgi:hypothetical protein
LSVRVGVEESPLTKFAEGDVVELSAVVLSQDAGTLETGIEGREAVTDAGGARL